MTAKARSRKEKRKAEEFIKRMSNVLCDYFASLRLCGHFSPLASPAPSNSTNAATFRRPCAPCLLCHR